MEWYLVKAQGQLYLLPYSPYLEAVTFICNPRTRHALVTGTHIKTQKLKNCEALEIIVVASLGTGYLTLNLSLTSHLGCYYVGTSNVS
jgi:hypothetical protein